MIGMRRALMVMRGGVGLVAVVVMLLLPGMAAHVQSGENASLRIEGMACPFCERSAERTLRSIPGVKDADADYRTGKAQVTYDPGETSPERIVEAFNGRSFYRASIDPNPQRGQGGS